MEKEKVLVVEDHLKQNKILCDIVEEAGYTAIPAFNGIEAFAQLRKHRRGLGFLSNKISCVLLDWNMPEMNGEQFIKILRKEEHQKTFRKYIPVVIVSAYDEDEKKELSADSYFGMAAAYITKPYKKPEITDILNRIIKQNDSETLIELNREYILNKSPKQLEDEKKLLMKLEAYYTGENNEEALEYIGKIRDIITVDYDKCFFSGNYKPERMEFLQRIKLMCDEEHNAILTSMKIK
ncbi:MAG: hypothetical protein A2Y40_03960 [Candidatus Margulisbacteria bacterium GWF2_35_9]|nr:MAG: hypothetical protein A2Y40_03960 [Candidatus Margulisbacteria bacterium GWF2_35_9]